MTTSTKDLIAKADHLAVETWINGEGLGGELSETFTKLSKRLRELDMKIEKSDALNDSAYISGAQAGFNCALSDDVEALNKLITSRNGYLKPINCGGAVLEAT